jgi:hypothetical protein
MCRKLSSSKQQRKSINLNAKNVMKFILTYTIIIYWIIVCISGIMAAIWTRRIHVRIDECFAGCWSRLNWTEYMNRSGTRDEHSRFGRFVHTWNNWLKRRWRNQMFRHIGVQIRNCSRRSQIALWQHWRIIIVMMIIVIAVWLIINNRWSFRQCTANCDYNDLEW